MATRGISNEQYMSQRFNKALSIVQGLPASSSFQPTNEEKLQLYGLYKQASLGDCNTSRPGMWDVVGRAKWDAWHRIRGMSVLEAKEKYVETILKFLRKFPDRPQALNIVETFTRMRPPGYEDSSDDDSDLASDEAEKEAYLDTVDHVSSVGSGRSGHSNRSRPPTAPRAGQPRPRWAMAPSVTSLRSEQSVTSPRMRPQQQPAQQQQQHVPYPPSYQPLLGLPPAQRYQQQRQQGQPVQQQQQQYLRTHQRQPSESASSINERFITSDEMTHYSDSPNASDVDPEEESEGEDEDAAIRQVLAAAQSTPLNLTLAQLRPHHPSPPLRWSPRQSPRQSPTLPPPTQQASVTATRSRRSTTTTSSGRHRANSGSVPTQLTPFPVRATTPQGHNGGSSSVPSTPRGETPHPVVPSVLGLAVERALESLQTDVAALNERIEILRKEMADRERKKKAEKRSWGWLFRATAKHALINFLILFVCFIFLLRRRSPIAYAVMSYFGPQIRDLWKVFVDRIVFWKLLV